MLETERLLMRNFEIEDVSSCLEGWGKDKHLGKYVYGYPMQETQMTSFVRALTQNCNAWVIVEKESQKCIGYVTVDIPYMQLGIGEIGYVIGEQHQHKGYAYESVKCILQEYLVVRNLYMIEAKYNTDNLASGHLLQKLGFVMDGELRDRRMDFITGRRSNLAICSVTKEEYLASCSHFLHLTCSHIEKNQF